MKGKAYIKKPKMEQEVVPVEEADKPASDSEVGQGGNVKIS